jgi:type II secretory ATPase GspE/PulE/Tfp pilus assembly ATPase PilB-like protein
VPFSVLRVQQQAFLRHSEQELAKAMRTALCQYPDVIMVGERDE